MASSFRFLPRLFQLETKRKIVSRLSQNPKVVLRPSSTFRRARPTDRDAAYRFEYPQPLPEPEASYPGYKVSYEEFKYVERLLPKEVVPEPPAKALDGKRTPSGWVCPNPDSTKKHPYFVHRTKNHLLPIYLLVKNGQTRILTKLQKVDGDIWQLEADLRKYLEENWQPKIRTQVHEISSYIIVKGDCCDQVCRFLLDKGF